MSDPSADNNTPAATANKENNSDRSPALAAVVECDSTLIELERSVSSMMLNAQNPVVCRYLNSVRQHLRNARGDCQMIFELEGGV